MFERNIYDQYQLFCEERFLLGDFEALFADGHIYVFVPEDGHSVLDRVKIAELLRERGESGVAELVLTVRKGEKTVIDGIEGSLFKVMDELNRDYHAPVGYRLALMHERGEQLGQVHRKDSRLTYFNRWNEIWEKRLEQLERWYFRLSQYGAQSEMDDLFLTTFPYYLGLSENAIQYYINSRADHPLSQTESSTICHQQFTDQSWLILPNQSRAEVKLPTDFIIDHYSRDLAEYIRYRVLKNKATLGEIEQFIADYSYVKPLSSYAWQLIYSRLLFPVYYFSAVEQYYGNQIIDRHPQLAQHFLYIVDRERENEQLLKNVSELMHNEQLRTIDVEWLYTKPF